MAVVTIDSNSGEDTVASALEAQGVTGVERASLPVGDYRISHGNSVVLLERKTLSDWASSLCDGRLKSQQARAAELEEQSGIKMVYLLEGGPPSWSPSKSHGLPRSSVAASVLKTSLRDGYHVIHTSCEAETAAAVAYIAAQMAKGGLEPRTSTDAAAALGKRPREVRAAKHPLVVPLSAITGVSLATAEAIAGVFSSAGSLVQASEQELADVKIKADRRLGPALAKRIKLCFS